MKAIILAAALTFGVLAVPAHAAPVNKPAVTEPTLLTAAIQQRLAGYGYSVQVDGYYGPQTTAAVQAWQTANGLTADGVAGPQTLLSLGIQPAPAWVAGDCDSFRPLIDKYGLPWDWSRRIMQRESHCDPSAFNGSGRDESRSLFQLNTKGSMWAAWQRLCGVQTKDQLFDPEWNIKCAAAAYRVLGAKPWRT